MNQPTPIHPDITVGADASMCLGAQTREEVTYIELSQGHVNQRHHCTRGSFKLKYGSCFCFSYVSVQEEEYYNRTQTFHQ